jgi:hypothetical protein
MKRGNGIKDRDDRSSGIEVLMTGNGIKDRDDRSSGIEVLMTDAFIKINPTDPFRLTKQVVRRKRNSSDSSGNSLVRTGVSTTNLGYSLS